ncbi:hypothetical protein [Xenorhabdus kozodoii]|uniref:Aldos-2-ulose dehydratase beta-propeller domain-containing protein n=1 Tax=Xenorhabdus kozodoii TaxID=351676 RepID=A0A2D0LC44_9GAMM|nr:hypothetical protein [Xenorhabdus kozodoii]PHM73258.1 hypothetical protein Xkoz_02149 [Xenorhabdus kozodoii]
MKHNKYIKNFPPCFTPQIVAERLRDGYWIQSFDVANAHRYDLVAYGPGVGEIYWYENILTIDGVVEWKRHLLVDNIRMPVGMDNFEIAGSGRQDIIICYDLYGDGGTFHDPSPNGGKIDWLENPGTEVSEDVRWKRRYIGQIPTMHRLRAGYFTQKDRMELVGFPIVSATAMHGVIPVALFTRPDNVLEAGNWPMKIIDNHSFRFVHGVEKKTGLIPDSDLDSLIISSDEGVSWFYYDKKTNRWVRHLIGIGDVIQVEKTHFKGSGDADVGRLGNEQFGYVAALEPFHGNTVVVYCKQRNADPRIVKWKRYVLDVFGDPDIKGESPGHCIVCADFDNDGDDEFLVGLRGPAPWQGVMYYKAIDAENGVFAKWRVGEESVARITLGDFLQRGVIDFSTIGYSVPNYFEASNPKVMVYYNNIIDQDNIFSSFPNDEENEL